MPKNHTHMKLNTTIVFTYIGIEIDIANTSIKAY